MIKTFHQSIWLIKKKNTYLLKRKFDNDQTINYNILKFLSISQREFFFSDLLEF